MKRTPLVRKTPLVTRTSLVGRSVLVSRVPLNRGSAPIKQVSKRRAKENRKYTDLRREFLESRPRCEFPGCTARSEQVHHMRGRVGALFLAVEHWLPICPTHHEFATTHPAEAIALGISESRLSA